MRAARAPQLGGFGDPLFRIVDRDEAPLPVQGRERRLEIIPAGADRQLALLGPALPGDLAEFARAMQPGEIAKHAAGMRDTGELLLVAQQNDLGPGMFGMTQQPCQQPGRNHPSLVDHDDGAPVPYGLAAIEAPKRAVDRPRVQPVALQRRRHLVGRRER